MKDFNNWTLEKIKINEKCVTLNIKEATVWWCSYGVNIGREQDGSDKNFERPIMILKKYSKDTFLCLPFTTKSKLDKISYEINLVKIKGYLLLDQARVIDKKRLKRFIEIINKEEFNKIKIRFKDLI